MALLALMAAAALVMHAADPDGPVIGLFLVAAFAPLRPPLRVAGAILVAATLVYNVLQLLIAGETLLLTIATDAGVAFFFLVGTLLRRERQQREALARVMAALEDSQAAQRAAAAEAERAAPRGRRPRRARAHAVRAGAAARGRHPAGDHDADRPPPGGGRTTSPPALPQRPHRGTPRGRRAARRPAAGPGDIPTLVEEHRLASAGVVTFRQTGDPVDLPAEVGAALYRAAQEALSNVRKHAGNAAVEVHLAWDAQGGVELTVADSGGEATASADGAGYGLSGMAERVRAVGGPVTAGADAGSGFRVHVAVP